MTKRERLAAGHSFPLLSYFKRRNSQTTHTHTRWTCWSSLILLFLLVSFFLFGPRHSQTRGARKFSLPLNHVLLQLSIHSTPPPICSAPTFCLHSSPSSAPPLQCTAPLVAFASQLRGPSFYSAHCFKTQSKLRLRQTW